MTQMTEYWQEQMRKKVLTKAVRSDGLSATNSSDPDAAGRKSAAVLKSQDRNGMMGNLVTKQSV